MIYNAYITLKSANDLTVLLLLITTIHLADLSLIYALYINVHSIAYVYKLICECSQKLSVQVYPNERHGIRSAEANEHFETVLISFLQKNL